MEMIFFLNVAFSFYVVLLHCGDVGFRGCRAASWLSVDRVTGLLVHVSFALAVIDLCWLLFCVV